jgi:hypothetical protein
MSLHIYHTVWIQKKERWNVTISPFSAKVINKRLTYQQKQGFLPPKVALTGIRAIFVSLINN